MSERSGPTEAEARCGELLMECMRVFVEQCDPLPAELDKFEAGINAVIAVFQRRESFGRHYSNPLTGVTVVPVGESFGGPLDPLGPLGFTKSHPFIDGEPPH